MGSDSGGYLTGRAFGRHKLAPSISPSKTVEVALGALAGAMVIAALCRLVFFAGLGSSEALVLGAAISVLAQFGDLCESALKRAFGAKDSGWIIPGHGGILDRLDSLLFPSCSRTTTPSCHGPEGDDGHPFPLGDGAVVL